MATGYYIIGALWAFVVIMNTEEAASASQCNSEIIDEQCVNGGICSFLLSGFTYCKCPEGYYGDQCENKLVSECERAGVKSPCENGGTCTVLETDDIFDVKFVTYTCTCIEGYSGDYCEDDGSADLAVLIPLVIGLLVFSIVVCIAFWRYKKRIARPIAFTNL